MPSAEFISLTALCLHYSSLTVLMHLSRASQSKFNYHASSAVVMTELFKFIISFIFAIHQSIVQINLQSSLRLSPQAKFEPHFDNLPHKEDGDEAEEIVLASQSISQNRFEPEENLDHHSKPDQSTWNEDSDRLISGLISQIHNYSTAVHQRKLSSEGFISNQNGNRKRLTSGNGTLLHSSSSMETVEPTSHNRRISDRSHRMSVEASPRLVHPSNSPIHRIYLLLEAFTLLRTSVFSQNWWLLGIPAVMFVIQNNLQYLAASNLSVPLFQITYQLKILTTALCSVFLLKRSLKKIQWLSLFILTAGVAIVQSSSQTKKIEAKPMIPHSEPFTGSTMDLNEAPRMNKSLGITAVVSACLFSGFASVYLERMFKSTSNNSNKPTNNKESKKMVTSYSPGLNHPKQNNLLPSSSIWIKNIQLSGFGILFSTIIVLLEDKIKNPMEFLSGLFSSSSFVLKTEINPNEYQVQSFTAATKSFLKSKHDNFFVGFSHLTWMVILFQVVGGILNSFVMKFSNNINKNFSICLSIIISILFNNFFWSSDHHDPQYQRPDEQNFNLQFFVGSFMVFFSTWLFNI